MAPSRPRLLVVRSDRIGDFVLTLPMLASLRQGYPHHDIEALLAPRVAPLAAATPLIDHVITPGDGWLQTAGKLRDRGYELAVFPYAKPGLAAAAALAGIPRRVGNGLRLYSPLFTDRVKVHRSHPPLHEADYCQALLAPLHLQQEPPTLPSLTPPDPAAADSILTNLGLSPGRFVLVHPGGGGSAGRPDAATFARFAQAARDRSLSGATIAVSAGPGEEALAATTADAAGGLALPPVPDLNSFLALIARSGLFLAGSTGPLHLAAASGTPTLGFYPWKSSQTAARWAPRGRATGTISPPKSSCADCEGGTCTRPACFARIPLKHVADAAGLLTA